jgi:hypothetical protein
MTSRIILADKPEEKKWPRLRVNCLGTVFLCISEKTAICLVTNRVSVYEIGDCIPGAIASSSIDLTDFHGTVELSNE